jgi:hypothetical protein
VFEYIRNDAPMIIHLTNETRNTKETLTNDTHYRSLLETQTSGGIRDKGTRKQMGSYHVLDQVLLVANHPNGSSMVVGM